jgi:hypothetical protein
MSWTMHPEKTRLRPTGITISFATSHQEVETKIFDNSFTNVLTPVTLPPVDSC